MGANLRSENSKPDTGINRSDLGRADSLRYNVLTFVVDENYDRAIQEMKAFLEADFEYPNFRGRVERYIQHGVDLVNAIRAKRKFPGVQMLTMARQQDLNEKFRAHFLELTAILKKIENIQHDVRINDVRSTVWVVRALVAAVMVITLVAFILDAHGGLVATIVNVFNDLFDEFNSWLFKKF